MGNRNDKREVGDDISLCPNRGWKKPNGYLRILEVIQIIALRPRHYLRKDLAGRFEICEKNDPE